MRSEPLCRIHILSPGPTTSNGAAFLFPLIVWRRALFERGLDIRFFTQDNEACLDTDTLIIDSKFHRDWWTQRGTESVLSRFEIYRARVRTLIYMDTTDSSGWLQTELLPHIDRYCKNQVLRNRQDYLRPFYGHRPHTDYYHRTKGVRDGGNEEWSLPVENAHHLSKIQTGWCSGLADYSLWGPLRQGLYRRCAFSPLLAFPRTAARPDTKRKQALQARFGTGHGRASVRWQREEIRQILGGRMATGKLGRRAFWADLKRSFAVLSPFGYGEITLKDFEVFLTGGVLVKPDMDHLETWPNLFRKNETYVPFSWDLEDLEEVLERIENNRAQYAVIAQQAQDLYARHTSGPEAPALFAAHLKTLIA